MFSSEYCEIFKNTYFEERPRATASVGVNMIGRHWAKMCYFEQDCSIVIVL